MIPLGFGFNENQRHQNCISQDASVTGFKRKVRNPGPEDHIRLHFFEPGLRTFLTYSLCCFFKFVFYLFYIQSCFGFLSGACFCFLFGAYLGFLFGAYLDFLFGTYLDFLFGAYFDFLSVLI